MAEGRRRAPPEQAGPWSGPSAEAATPWDEARALDPVEEVPFWRRKRLSEMTASEWESLCDGCGRCCLVKLEDEDTGCRMLDPQGCGCRDYANRSEAVHDCVRLTPEVLEEIGWLPPTCGYRLIADGKDLYWWHPLVSGDPDTVHQAGVSVRGRVKDLEDDVTAEALEQRIVSWPLRWPKRARVRPAKPPQR
jgi:uncharacterized cysteine cluster protein YcgN (CxxCxxCC family)